ncbi:MAG: hypothetical protein OSJ36_05750 [Odoribacter sp.]|nr:hypothetical protein [Odoribacter sp.]
MAQLSSVIGSILRDIIAAQHEANLYSLSLSESYGKDGKTKDFQLPNIVISDMELELKYGVVSASENQEQQNIRYSKFRQFIKELCYEASETAIANVVSSVLISPIRRSEDDKRFFYRLRQEEALNKKFHTFLMRNMRKAFDNNLYESLETATGYVQTGVVVSRLMDVVRKKFLYNTDLDNLFDGIDGKALRETADTTAENALTVLVEKLSAGLSFKRVKSFPQLDVAVTAEELEKMSGKAIHSFKLKFSPSVCSVTSLEEEDEWGDFVMD